MSADEGSLEPIILCTVSECLLAMSSNPFASVHCAVDAAGEHGRNTPTTCRMRATVRTLNSHFSVLASDQTPNTAVGWRVFATHKSNNKKQQQLVIISPSSADSYTTIWLRCLIYALCYLLACRFGLVFLFLSPHELISQSFDF